MCVQVQFCHYSDLLCPAMETQNTQPLKEVHIITAETLFSFSDFYVSKLEISKFNCLSRTFHQKILVIFRITM